MLSLPEQPLPQGDESDIIIGLLEIFRENNQLFFHLPVLSRELPESFSLNVFFVGLYPDKKSFFVRPYPEISILTGKDGDLFEKI